MLVHKLRTFEWECWGGSTRFISLETTVVLGWNHGRHLFYDQRGKCGFVVCRHGGNDSIPKQRVIKFKPREGAMFWVTALTAAKQSQSWVWEQVHVILWKKPDKTNQVNNHMLNLNNGSTTRMKPKKTTNIEHIKKLCQDNISLLFNKCTLGTLTRQWKLYS